MLGNIKTHLYQDYLPICQSLSWSEVLLAYLNYIHNTRKLYFHLCLYLGGYFLCL